MGGYGSGRWLRYNKQTTTDNVNSIDVCVLRKSGCIPRAVYWGGKCVGTLSWSRGDQPAGTVSYEATYDGIVFRIVESGLDICETVWFDRTDCHFGGQRIWFHCPNCGRRIGVIHLAGGRFLCRHCHKLPYSSQREAYTDRMYRKARRIRKRLGASNNVFESVWDKPKGMHWRTFERLQERERATTTLAMRSLMLPLQRIL
jgi:hypothetical protein